jgi:hypothetical protein
VARLEKVFAAIDKKPQSKTCDAIVGITDEGAEIMKENTKVRLPSTQAYLRRRKRSSTTKSLATAHSKHGRMSSD